MRSRFVALAVLVGAPCALAVACAQITGVSDYDRVYCSGTGCSDGGSPDDVVGRDVDSGGPDDVRVNDVVVDAIPPPAPTRAWARWRMPSPVDAGPGTVPAAYADSGNVATVLDAVTGLEWEKGSAAAASLGEATNHCASLVGTGWLVPTRIELVSILDPSRNPPIDPAFGDAGASGAYWTASPTTGGALAPYWSVDFTTAAVANGPGLGQRVRCVRRVKP